MLGEVASPVAELLTEFIPANQIIPTTEGILRIFDRKSQTFKSTFEILLKEIGKTNFTIGRRREKSVTAYSRN
jgi:sulfite reductase (ferredoxin)